MQNRSIIGSVGRLYEVGSPIPATLILAFSVSCRSQGCAGRVGGLHRRRPAAGEHAGIVEAIAKWSMADVFVVALFIVYLAAQASAMPTSGVRIIGR